MHLCETGRYNPSPSAALPTPRGHCLLGSDVLSHSNQLSEVLFLFFYLSVRRSFFRRVLSNVAGIARP